MSDNQLLTPPKDEIESAVSNWMQEVAPGKQEVDGYSREQLIDIAEQSVWLYNEIWKLFDKPSMATDENIKKALIPFVKKSESIKAKRFIHNKRRKNYKG